MKNKVTIIIVSSILALAVITAGLYAAGLIFRESPLPAGRPASQDSGQAPAVDLSAIKIEPLKSGSGGIDTSSGFRLLCDGSVGDSFLDSSLKVVPEQPFTLKKEAKGEYLLNFSAPLKANSIVKLQIKDESSGKDRSWAFQTQQAFRVARTLPRKEAVQVPVDSGIEITFTNENVENLQNYFDITPEVKGRFEYHKKTAVFVPESLEYGTIYTVTVKKGLGYKGSDKKLEEDYRFSFQTVLKNSNAGNSGYFTFAEAASSFTPQNTPALQVFCSEDVNSKTLNVEVFKYSDEKKYLLDLKKYDTRPIWAVADNGGRKYDLSGLQSVTSFPAVPARYEMNYGSTVYLVFPSRLPEGYYLVKASFDGKDYYCHVQVNRLSVYIMVADNKTLAWAFDASTGKPASGAVFSGDSLKQEAAVSEDGLASADSIAYKANTSSYYFTLADKNGPAFVARTGLTYYYPYGDYYSSNATNDYWSYLYLDKGMYLPDDTINLWGMVKPRDTGMSSAEATLELVRNDSVWNDDTGGETAIEEQKASLSPYGTFTGHFRISNYTPGSYLINVKINGNVVKRNYFEVVEYAKPAYKIDLTPSKNVMYGWEKFTMNVHAAFYEGSPLPGLGLDYNYNTGYANGNDKNGKLTLDNAGNASLQLSAATGATSWRPQTFSFNVHNASAEEEEINASSYVSVFPRDTMLELDSKINGNSGTINITTSKIDISRLDGSGVWFSEDQFRSTSVNTNVTIRLYEKYWVAKETGEYYDFINKKKVKRYDYSEAQKLVNQYSVETVNGKASIPFAAEKDKNYYVEAQYSDSRGMDTIETQYIYSWSFSPYDLSSWSFSAENNKTSYRTGETAVLKVREKGQEMVPSANSRFLYVKLKNGVLSSASASEPQYSFLYGKEDIPNIYIKAVYFDGTYLHDAGIQELRYDYNEKKLSIGVTPDKKSYKPGDTVKLSVDVKDPDGKPCKAEVNISAIDEAFFAVMDQYVDTLGGIYSPPVSSGLITDYISYRAPGEDGSPMAENGEGGDALTIRKEFKDSACFTTASTDEKGHAEVSFKLPDNLTEWRITYQALTDDLKAGSGKTSVTTKLPFFVDTIFNRIFMSGDTPSLIIRSYGTALKSSDKVNYSISLDNGTGPVKSFSTSAAGNAGTTLPLGKLEEGDYTLTIKGSAGNLSDGLQKSFRVVPEMLQAARLETMKLAEDLRLPEAKTLTTLSFLNKDASSLYNELLSLNWTWGERLDQKLSRKLAGDLLKKYYNESYISEEELDFGSYQLNDGGLALLTYDSSDPRLSAEVSALVRGSIDENALASYFYNLLNSKDTSAADAAYCYWGLSALDRPVLMDIQSLLSASADKLGLEEKLVLGTALACLGDDEGAEKVYKDILAEKAKQDGDMSYIDAGLSRDDTTKATALCAILALKLDQPEKLSLFNYAKANSTSELLTNLERLIYVSAILPGVNRESSFSYELDGKKQEIVIKSGEKHTLILTPEKLAAIRFTNIKGDVAVTASCTGPVRDLIDSSSGLVGLRRVYSVKSTVTDSFKRSDLIRIELAPTFTENCPDGYYQVTDILPAGFRYVTARFEDKDGMYPDEISGQKVTFGFRYDKNSTTRKNIVYYARAVTPGTFTADNAFIKYSENNISGFAEKKTVTIE